MKILSVLDKEESLLENELLAENAAVTINSLEETRDNIRKLKYIVKHYELDEEFIKEIQYFISETDDFLDMIVNNELVEGVQRQFKRYGDRFLRQFRCTDGQKRGRLVTSPDKCGIRKNPRRVRIGKLASRRRKGERIRKILFTKRKAQSKRVTQLNKMMRGEFNGV